MYKVLRGVRIGRRAIVIGCVLAGASATAVGAAAGHPIMSDSTRAFVETLPTEPATTAPPQTTSPETTEPASTEPATTEPVTTEPVTIATEPPATEPASTEPVTTEPAPATTEPEPATTAAAPAPTEPPVTEAPAPAPKPNDNVVPATLSLSCATLADNPTAVACSWSGALPDGFSRFALLRGDPDGKGRVPFMSGDGSASSFLDQPVAAGKHSYVLVALDAASHPLAHSNMVLIEIAA